MQNDLTLGLGSEGPIRTYLHRGYAGCPLRAGSKHSFFSASEISLALSKMMFGFTLRNRGQSLSRILVALYQNSFRNSSTIIINLSLISKIPDGMTDISEGKKKGNQCPQTGDKINPNGQ